MGKTIIVRFYASTGYAGSDISDEIEIDREEWESMSFDEKNNMLHDILYGLEYGWIEDEVEDGN